MSSIDPSSKLSGMTPPPIQLNTAGDGGGSNQTSTSYGDVVLGGPQMDYFLNTQEAAISASLDQFNQNLSITEEFQSDVQALLNAVNEVAQLTPGEISNLSTDEAYQLSDQDYNALVDLMTAEQNLVDFSQQPATQAWLSQNPDFASQLDAWTSTGYNDLWNQIDAQKDALFYYSNDPTSANASTLDNCTGAMDTSSLNSLMESLTTISSSETTQFSVLTKEQLSLVKSMQSLLTTFSQTASQIVNQIAPT